MQALLTIQDLIPLLRVSEPTLRRWLAETRKGTGNFPKPINGFKRKLLFHPDEIERWAGCRQQSTPVAKIESVAARQRRHNAALSSLRSKGVNVTPKGEES